MDTKTNEENYRLVGEKEKSANNPPQTADSE